MPFCYTSKEGLHWAMTFINVRARSLSFFIFPVRGMPYLCTPKKASSADLHKGPSPSQDLNEGLLKVYDLLLYPKGSTLPIPYIFLRPSQRSREGSVLPFYPKERLSSSVTHVLCESPALILYSIERAQCTP